MKFIYGLNYNEIEYGWKDKQLYRLPYTINKRSYPLKKLKEIRVGNNVGYRLSGMPRTISQLKEITIHINKFYSEFKDSDLPF